MSGMFGIDAAPAVARVPVGHDESQRDSMIQPRVGAQRLPWGIV